MTVEISPTGTYTTYAYDANGNVTRIRVYEVASGVPGDGGSEEEQPGAPGSNYRETVFGYDNLNRMVNSVVNNVQGRVFDGAIYVSQGWGLETRYQYDANGNVTLTIDPNGYGTYAYYDALGRKYSQVDTGGYRTDWSYDANGNVTRERRYANMINGGGIPPTVSADDYNDRITDYQYDALGNRLNETRLFALLHDGAGNQYYAHPYVSYLYNALGQVTRKTEATGDYGSYEYDSSGRLMREIKSGYTDYGGAAVSPRVEYRYDASGNLTRTTMAGNGNVADRVTRYTYEAGKLVSVADAEQNDGDGRDGKITNYWYDLVGNVTAEYYTRYDSAGAQAQGAVHDGTLRSYDAEGRVTQERVAQYRYNSSAGYHEWYDVSPVTTTTYTTYGEVASVSTGGGSTRYNQYDAAGRLTGTNGDGAWKVFSYDKNGNQTAMVESAGGDIAGQGFDWALGQSGRADINATYTTYDARGMAVAVHEEGRDLSEGVSGQMLVTSRLYNAFGEVSRETSAAGAQIDYSYNTMGKLVRIENPTVSVQYENGGTANVRPTEQFYYDQSGRLVAQRDANGNLTRLSLLAGTGYDGGKALVTAETHADGGVIRHYYDAQGDVRITVNEVGRNIAMAYDQMGRLVQKTDNGSGLADYYTYDGLGQQLTHWNSQLGSGNMEVSDYDYAGRVISQRAFGGDVTTSSYGWNAAIGGGFGGWSESTSFANGRSQFNNTDIFGKVRARGDQGGHAYSYYYDNAGRLSAMTQDGTSTRQDYTYYNTGKLKTITLLAYESGTDYNSQTTAYGYDRAGNVVLQRTTEQGQETYSYGYYDSYEPYTYANSWNRQTQNITAAYDALGRMSSWSESGSTGAPAASASYSYDANGNIRRVGATWRPLDQQGADAGYAATQEDWYRYDGMNRVVISHGALAGGMISRGARGKEIHYNAAGQRAQAWSSFQGSYRYWVNDGGGGQLQNSPLGGYDAASASGYWATVSYTADLREDYQYDGAGRVSQVLRAESSFDGAGYEERVALGMNPNPQNYVSPPGAGVLAGVFSHDAMGRLASQTDYANGSTMVYSRAVTYDAAGRVYTDDSTTRRGSDLLRALSTSYYNPGEGGAYAVTTTNWKNGSTSGAPGTRIDNTYLYWDPGSGSGAGGAVQSTVRYDADTGSSSNAIFTSSYKYDAFGRLTSASVNDGRPRTVTWTNDVSGQVIRRDEADNSANGDPHELYYRLAGKQLGAVGNNGTDNVDYKASNDQRSTTPGTGAFRGGAAYGIGFAEFGGDYDAINSYSQGSAGGLYTVRGGPGSGSGAGESLQAIALQLWGDAGLWYKLAETNPGAGRGLLAEGTTLSIPTGVQRVHHNASTLKPYDPAEALGDTSPTTPTPAKPKNNKCGVFGAILLAVVAVAVTVITAGAALSAAGLVSGGVFGASGGVASVLGGGLLAEAGVGGALAIGAVSGTAGSIASQGLGVATGIQDKFSWKAVGMAALGGALGGVVNGGASFGERVLRGALSSAAVQGIGVATGLQSKFSWAGVAAAGVGTGVGGAIGGALAGSKFGQAVGSFASGLMTSAASSIASAATRSAIEGSSFGQNIIAAIPDVVGQALGNAFARGLVAKASTSATRASGEQAASVLTSPAFEAALPALNKAGIHVIGEGASMRLSLPEGFTSFSGKDVDGEDFILRVDPVAAAGDNQYRIGTYAVTMDGTPIKDGVWEGDVYIHSLGGAPTSISFGRAKGLATRIILNANGGIVYNSRDHVYSNNIGLQVAFSRQNPFSTPVVVPQRGSAPAVGNHGVTLGGFLNTTAEVVVPGYYASNRGGEAFRAGNYWNAAGWYALSATEVGLTVATLGSSSLLLAGVRGGVRGGILVTERLAVTGATRLTAAESATPVMRGIAFENTAVAAARAEAFLPGESVRRLSVRAFDDAGNLLPGRTVLDLAGHRGAGQLGALEFKLHEGVALRGRQAQHFPNLARNGGVVVGEKGLPLGLRPGAPIGPLDVQRINGSTLPLTWWLK